MHFFFYQNVNMHIQGRGIAEKAKKGYAVLNCRVSKWPLSYLGLPLGGNLKSKVFWDSVVEKVARRLDGWKTPCLSLGGRITLIQPRLSHIPNYFLSLFKVPDSVVSKLEKLQRDFLWLGTREGKKDHLLSWEVV